jgi:hypothetical protein
MTDLQKTPNPTKLQERLDRDIDFMELIDWLAEGKGYKRFAQEKANCSVFAIFTWAKATPERCALIESAQEAIAESYVEKGEEHLLSVDVSNKDTAAASVALAKALDNHYRWKASKHGRKYSESIKLHGDKDEPVSMSIVINE